MYISGGHLEFLYFLCNDRIPVAWHRREGFLPCSDAGSQHYLLHLLFLLENATKTRCILILLASVMQYQNLVIFNLEDSLQDIFVLFSQDGFEYSCPKGFNFLFDPLAIYFSHLNYECVLIVKKIK